MATAIVFTPGCTLRCGYCHNPELLSINPQLISTDDVIEKIRQLSWSLDGVVITGGEPTIQDGLVEFCETLHSLGLKVKLDTNGTMPDVLRRVIPHVDYVAMDVKAPLDEGHVSMVTATFGVANSMRRSMKLIIDSGVDHEFRTTWDPNLTEKDVLEIATIIPTTWVLQEFRPIKCLNDAYMSYHTTDYNKLKDTAKVAAGPAHILIRSEHHGEESIKG